MLGYSFPELWKLLWMQLTKMSIALVFSKYVVAFYQTDKMYYNVDL